MSLQTKTLISMLGAALVAAAPMGRAQHGEKKADGKQVQVEALSWDEARSTLIDRLTGIQAPADKKAQMALSLAISRNFMKYGKFLGGLNTKLAGMHKKLGKPEAKPEEDAVKGALKTLGKALKGGDGSEMSGNAASAAVVALKKRIDGMRKQYMLQFVNFQQRTGAKFAGQYNALRSLGNVKPMILDLVENPPPQIDDRFRALMVGALRDVCDKLSEKDVERINELVEDSFEDETVQRNAMFALHHFGKKEHVNKVVADLEKASKKSGNELESLRQLAEIHWDVRQYDLAVAAYKRAIPFMASESAQVQGSFYYNYCCSLALGKQIDEALKMLDKALTKWGSGVNPNLLRSDHDINNLRKDERFAELMKKHNVQLTPKAPKKADQEKANGAHGGGEGGK